MQYGWTALHFSAYNGHARMVQVLVERYNCAPDRPEKVCGVNVVLLTVGYYCQNSPFVILFLGYVHVCSTN